MKEVIKHWLITDKGDPRALALVDGYANCLIGRSGYGVPHYSRQKTGTRLFTRNGQNLVFITAEGSAVWVSFRPTPGKAVRLDKRNCWECSLFRNESNYLSSDLIREAVRLTWALWGKPTPGGLITFIRPDKTAKRRSKRAQAGACYIHAGWLPDTPSSDGKPCLRAPSLTEIPLPFDWQFARNRGGLLRNRLYNSRQYGLDYLYSGVLDR